jgi:hypothetical protein
LNIRNIIIIVFSGLLLLGSQEASAQRQKVENLPAYDLQPRRYGFILAMTQMDFRIKPISNLNTKMFTDLQAKDISADSAMLFGVTSDPAFGFSVGIVGIQRLGTYFDLQLIPTLTFGERYLDYRILKFRKGEQELIEIRKNIPSTFVQFPLSVRYKSLRLNNFAAYIIGGVSYNLDLASQAKKDSDQGQIQVKLYKHDLSMDIGFGFDFYFEWFKLGTEFKMSYGMFDMLKKEDNIYTDGIESMKSKIFQFSLTFE